MERSGKCSGANFFPASLRRDFAAGGVGGHAAQAKPAVPQPPAPTPSERNKAYAALAESCDACVVAGQAAVTRALVGGDKERVARSCADALAACGALAGLASLGAPFALAFARTVGDLCRVCKDDCDKNPGVKEYAAMGAACAACLRACRDAAS